MAIKKLLSSNLYNTVAPLNKLNLENGVKATSALWKQRK